MSATAMTTGEAVRTRDWLLEGVMAGQEDSRAARWAGLELPGRCLACGAALVWNGIAWLDPATREPHCCPARRS